MEGAEPQGDRAGGHESVVHRRHGPGLGDDGLPAGLDERGDVREERQADAVDVLPQGATCFEGQLQGEVLLAQLLVRGVAVQLAPVGPDDVVGVMAVQHAHHGVDRPPRGEHDGDPGL